MKQFVIRLIRLYQAVSRSPAVQGIPLFAVSGCRSWPTCSDYSVEALQRYGLIRGGFKSIVRVIQCNPFFAPK